MTRRSSAAGTLRVVAAALGMLGAAAFAQAPEPASVALGGDVFARACATCHVAGSETRAPPLDARRSLEPSAVVTSLATGKMATQEINPTLRAIYTRDPDGFFIEIIERN